VKREYNLTFCESYEYPAEVKTHMYQILDAIVDKDIYAIMLMGSTCRGELSYCILDNRIEILSDYEFMIITRKPLNNKRKREIEERIDLLERQFCMKNALFHIDFFCCTVGSVQRLPHIIRYFELKRNAVAIFGVDIRNLVPNITIDNLDIRDTNELLWVRLWEVLKALPKNLLVGKVTAFDEMTLKYIFCRNVLDLTTLMLPNEGVLIPTYKQRVDYIEKHYSRLRFARYLGMEFPSFLQECLRGKLYVKFDRSWPELYELALRYFLGAIRYVFGVKEYDDEFELSKVISTRSFAVFGKRRPKRLAYEFMLTLQHLKRRGLACSLRWFLLPKKGYMLIFLINMHLALYHWIKQDDNSRFYLEVADKTIQELSLTSEENAPLDDFMDSWLRLRFKFSEYLSTVYRLEERKEKRTKAMLRR